MISLFLHELRFPTVVLLVRETFYLPLFARAQRAIRFVNLGVRSVVFRAKRLPSLVFGSRWIGCRPLSYCHSGSAQLLACQMRAAGGPKAPETLDFSLVCVKIVEPACLTSHSCRAKAPT